MFFLLPFINLEGLEGLTNGRRSKKRQFDKLMQSKSTHLLLF